VPIGVFLSGGVDSSAVAAYAAAKLGEGRLGTFSIGFEDQDFDESAYARLAAHHVRSTHHEEVLSLDKAVSLLPDIMSRLDEPMGDSSILPTHLLCRHARRTATVALGGDGADELFGGYAPFRALRWAKFYQRWVPGRLHTAIKYLADRMPATHRYMALDFKIKRVLRGLGHSPRLWNPVWMSPLEDRELSELFCEPVDVEDVFSEAIELWDDSPAAGLVDRTLQFFTRLYLQNDILTKIDRASMWHSLEVRSPFLDIDLVNFARTIPADCKVRRSATKYLLKRALEPVLPREILDRSKQGFAVPIARWFREGSMNVSRSGVAWGLSHAFIARKLSEQTRGKADNHAFLWNQWVLGAMGSSTRCHAEPGEESSTQYYPEPREGSAVR
jgi:asparagine synthase (glutamine-hydrolysing)